MSIHKKRIGKTDQHVTQSEGLIFEKSAPGKAYKLPVLDVPEVNAEKLLGSAVRADLGLMPEVSEIDRLQRSAAGGQGCEDW
jgi:glycine dehydrogenase subunit 2